MRDLKFNIHFHLLCLDGVYVQAGDRLQFRRVAAPTPGELQALLQRITPRVGRQLERRGLLVRDDENSYLSLEPREESALEGLLGHAITYRIAIGPQAGRKAVTLQTVPASPTLERDNPWLAKAAGFSLHAGVATGTEQDDKVERLCRYIARPAIASGRLVLTGQSDIRYPLQTRYRDGTTHVIFQPLADCSDSGQARRWKIPGRAQECGGTAAGDDLGAAPQARVAHRPRALCALRREAESHRKH